MTTTKGPKNPTPPSDETGTPSSFDGGPLLDDDAFAALMEEAHAKEGAPEDEALKARVWARLQESIAREPGGAAAPGAPVAPSHAVAPAKPRASKPLALGLSAALALAAATLLFVRLQPPEGTSPLPDAGEGTDIAWKGGHDAGLGGRLVATPHTPPSAEFPQGTGGATPRSWALALDDVPADGGVYVALFASAEAQPPALVTRGRLADLPPLTYTLPADVRSARVCAFVAESAAGLDALVEVAPTVFSKQTPDLCVDVSE